MAPGSHFLVMYKTKVCFFRPKWGHLLLHITLALSNCRLLLKEAVQCICLHLASGFCPLLHTGPNAHRESLWSSLDEVNPVSVGYHLAGSLKGADSAPLQPQNPTPAMHGWWEQGWWPERRAGLRRRRGGLTLWCAGRCSAWPGHPQLGG